MLKLRHQGPRGVRSQLDADLHGLSRKVRQRAACSGEAGLFRRQRPWRRISGPFVEVEIGMVLPQDEQPVIRAAGIRLGELKFNVGNVLARVSAETELIELGESNPRFEIDRS